MAIDFNRLGNPSSSASAGLRSQAPSRGNETASAEGTPRSSGETVQLSDEARQLSQIGDSLKQVAEVDHERVARIKQAIADGSYAVDNQRIASKLLGLEDIN